MLTGGLYNAPKAKRNPIGCQGDLKTMNYASKAYAKTATEVASPRELEASLLLTAAAKLQAVHDSWDDKPIGLNDALMYNRRLWTVFIDTLNRDDNMLPKPVRDNLTRLGVFIMAETFSLMTKPKPKHLKSMIKVNRSIAAGLRANA
jgi:flagellar biosynthesis activator protein FlaF